MAEGVSEVAMVTRSKLAIQALRQALDYIATAKSGKHPKEDMTMAQDYVVLALYRLRPGWLSPMDVTYLRAKGWLGPPISYQTEDTEVREFLAWQEENDDQK